MALKLYDTLTKDKRAFVPLDPTNVRMYVCGPTVYDFAHIGNARPVIVFDVLFRLLRHIYGEDHVTYVRNITDVDDKINDRAARDFPGLPLNEAIRKVTTETEKQFHADVDALGALRPTIEPRATEFINKPDAATDMVRLIGLLIANGNAYMAEGHVLFDVSSMPAYGRLARRSLDEMLAGARVEVAPYKKNAMDFVLWKPSQAGEPGWPSPWGLGRPGWHIECSAMAGALLGQTFDIHGGGIDLVFPHHENEIAQTCCAFHTERMAQVWMHNGFLQVEGEKMSKSLGNFITIRQLLDHWNGYGWPGEALRFNMLRAHYRQPIDWTLDGLDESHKTLWNWCESLEGVKPSSSLPDSVLEALADDLNTPKVISELHLLHRNQRREELLSALNLLGFSGDRKSLGRIASAVGTAAGSSSSSGRSYVLKAETGRFGVTGGDAALVAPQGYDKETIQRLVDARNAARARKDFKESDRIRDELTAMRVILKDGKDPATGEPVTTWEIAR